MLAQVGPYVVSIIGNEVSVTNRNKPVDLEDYSTYDVPPTKVEGLAKFLSWKKGIGVKLVQVEDMHIIYLIRRGTRYGTSYAINVTEPLFSEYGDCGLPC